MDRSVIGAIAKGKEDFLFWQGQHREGFNWEGRIKEVTVARARCYSEWRKECILKYNVV